LNIFSRRYSYNILRYALFNLIWFFWCNCNHFLFFFRRIIVIHNNIQNISMKIISIESTGSRIVTNNLFLFFNFMNVRIILFLWVWAYNFNITSICYAFFSSKTKKTHLSLRFFIFLFLFLLSYIKNNFFCHI
jgi:hypothetical protein